MKNLKLISILLIAVFSVANVCADLYWASGVTGDWDNPDTWGGSGYPVAGDNAYINLGSTVAVDGTAEAAQELHHGSWSGNSELVTLNIINGGSLEISGWTYVGVADGDVALLTVDAASSFTANDAFNVGYNGDGTLDVYGGTVNANGGFFVSNPWAAGTGAGTVNLLDGIINIGGPGVYTDFAMSSAGLIDIHAGTIRLYGLWWDDALNTYIGDSRIIGYGGAGTVNVNYDDDYTVITAIPEPMTLTLLGLGIFGVIIRRK